ncbi:MAG: YdeI/OmpD-associated family protein [Cellulomonadaceae bacterium]|nr:YdeI/OmpD-associated family protein [Cellulomonadaceae bacterium]
MAVDPLPELVVADAAAWRAWLDAHESESPGVWLVLARKGANGPTTLTYDEALDEALCSGWIDGQTKRRDDVSTFRRFTPRRARSVWSLRNTEHIARLDAQRRLRPRGRAEVDAAHADGRWDRAYGGSSNIDVPEELTAALEASPRAAQAFEALTKQERYSMLYRLAQAQRPETVTRNVSRYIVDLEQRPTVPAPPQGMFKDPEERGE